MKGYGRTYPAILKCLPRISSAWCLACDEAGDVAIRVGKDGIGDHSRNRGDWRDHLGAQADGFVQVLLEVVDFKVEHEPFWRIFGVMDGSVRARGLSWTASVRS